LNKDESFNIIKNNGDNYFYSFSECDKNVRSIETLEDYLSKIETVSFSSNEIEKMKKCIEKADKFFNTDFKYNKYRLFLDKTQWKLSMTFGDTYEFGYPHTRLDTIFVSNNIFKKPQEEIVRILIHEKIHIDQKKNPEKYYKIMENNGISRINSSSYNRRANPDTDNHIYSKNGQIYNMPCVKSKIHNHKLEHPFEEIAYDICDMYKV